MPLTAKEKKLKNKFKEQYGKKKGESVFYAMENSGKLKKVIKAKGGRDASRGDFSTGPGPGKGDLTGPRELGVTTRGPKSVGDKGNRTVTVTTPPNFLNPRPLGLLTPVSYQVGVTALNYGKKKSFDSRNLKDARKNDLLGGEMLTTGPTGPKGPKDPGGNKNIMANQPIQAISTTKTIDQSLVSPKDNFFNFVAYKVGGLSGGVSYGPPPKKGPNSQVPPVKMKRGGYKK